MKTLPTFILFLLLLLLSFGCESGDHTASGEMRSEQAMTADTEQQTDLTPTERKLIKEGRIEFQTESIADTRAQIFQAIENHEGYVAEDREFTSPGRRSNRLTVRIPAENFDGFLQAATQDVERFELKEINVKDVTEEFLDVQARLKTKKELEARLRELLQQANAVSEILEIEKQLGELRSEIESIEGRLQYLENQVSFSTLHITFYESVQNSTDFSKKFTEGFRNGWDNLIWFFVLLTNIWPFLLLAIALFLGFRFFRRKK